MIQEAISRLVDRQDLSRGETEAVFEEVFDGIATPSQVGALLVAFRLKGERSEEIAGAAGVVRRRTSPIVRTPPGRLILDTAGSGGDGIGTFNISTAVAFVASAAGATVAKHVTTSVSSGAGSADVLSALGVKVDVEVELLERCLADVGLAFMPSSRFHAELQRVAEIRSEIGVRSIFNLLGPLANPAHASRQLIGVFDGALVSSVGRALIELGTERSLVVHGDEGIDEISPTGPTRATLVDKGELWPLIVEPEDVGIPRTRLEDIRGGSGGDNADAMREVFRGGGGPLRDAVVLNAAAALWVYGLATDLRSGAEQARQVLDQGAALRKLEALVALTNGSA
jgi:anthranilate phosphoribosyltransferase